MGTRPPLNSLVNICSNELTTDVPSPHANNATTFIQQSTQETRFSFPEDVAVAQPLITTTTNIHSSFICTSIAENGVPLSILIQLTSSHEPPVGETRWMVIASRTAQATIPRGSPNNNKKNLIGQKKVTTELCINSSLVSLLPQATLPHRMMWCIPLTVGLFLEDLSNRFPNGAWHRTSRQSNRKDYCYCRGIISNVFVCV